ncbi:hypothetical protein [Paenibacillus koleovorans]|uniref:hypothetical protein n=1 Tax=Paenibacillus koleovorans TaxID=121608 RepID=UPI000FD98361|nr:hypothetical protein [Paenibacillus koleovorans]
MDHHELEQRVGELERLQLQYSPKKYMKKFVATTTDIYNERRFLNTVALEHKSIEHVAGILVEELAANKKFRRVECLKILKRMLKNRSSEEPFGKGLTRQLFALYQQFVLTGSEEAQGAVSFFIQELPLEEEQLQWLIDHDEESEHIVTRLLHYPERNGQVSDWAREVYLSGKLPDRLPEVLGLVIEEEVPDYVQVDNATLMWAIYHTRCSKGQKRKLILKHLDYEHYAAAVEVARKLNVEEVSKELARYYKDLLVKETDVVEVS